MTRQIILSLLLAGTFSCSHEPVILFGKLSCEVIDPTVQLPWLRESIAELDSSTQDITKYLYYQQAQYKGQTVFRLNNCCPYCDAGLVVYDCGGNTVSIDSSIPLTNISVIWKRKDCSCVFR